MVKTERKIEIQECLSELLETQQDIEKCAFDTLNQSDMLLNLVKDGMLKITIGNTPVDGKIKVVASFNGKTAEHIFDVTAKLPPTISISKFVEDKNYYDIQYLRGVVVADDGFADGLDSFILADEIIAATGKCCLHKFIKCS